MTVLVDLCGIEEVPNGRHKCMAADGKSILLFNHDGVYHAIENRCTHLDFPLKGGRQMGWEIICRQHGARFDVRNGRVLGGPAVDPVAAFAIRVEGGRLWLVSNVD